MKKFMTAVLVLNFMALVIETKAENIASEEQETISCSMTCNDVLEAPRENVHGEVSC